jgi:hypothetical protein
LLLVSGQVLRPGRTGQPRIRYSRAPYVAPQPQRLMECDGILSGTSPNFARASPDAKFRDFLNNAAVPGAAESGDQSTASWQGGYGEEATLAALGGGRQPCRHRIACE